MKLLLRHNIDNLGNRGDVVSVKRGYARNFLIPRGLGIEATPGAIKQFEFDRKRLEKEEVVRMAAMKSSMSELASFELTISVKANEEGHLFGSVNEQSISQALNEAGFAIEQRQVKLEAPIKELGIYQVAIGFGQEEPVEIKLWVVEAKETDEPAEIEESTDSAEEATAGETTDA